MAEVVGIVELAPRSRTRARRRARSAAALGAEVGRDQLGERRDDLLGEPRRILGAIARDERDRARRRRPRRACRAACARPAADRAASPTTARSARSRRRRRRRRSCSRGQSAATRLAVRVHRLDLARVLLRDDLALDLHRRRQLAGVDAERLRQDRELLDLLDARERLVDLVDLRPGSPSGSRRAIAVGTSLRAAASSSVTSAVRNLRRSPITTASPTSGDCLIAASMFFGAMFLPPAVMMISFLRPVIDRKPRASNAPRSPEHSQPSLQRLGRGLGLLVVAEEHVRAAHQDLAVVGDLAPRGRGAAGRPCRAWSCRAG